MMKKIFKFNRITVFFLIAATLFVFNPISVMACGFGNAGGSDYVPQRQGGAYASNQTASAIGSDQAKNIVGSHVVKLNPDLMVGNVNDSGGFFEVEIMNKNNEVVQLLGVDKYSGRLMLLN